MRQKTRCCSYKFANSLNSCIFSWAYQAAEELQSAEVPGLIATYGGGGFVQELGETAEMSALILAHLKVETLSESLVSYFLFWWHLNAKSGLK